MNDAINPEHYKQGSIECIDAMELVLTAEEYRGFLKGNAIKYLWREENKNGIEDLRKAKWYLDRLIEHCDESLLDANKPAKPPNEQPQPPDGWRWLNEDEVIRKGDAYWHGGKWWDYDNSIGAKVRDTVWPSIRRSRFEVGEKVVRVFTGVVYKVIRILSMGYQLESEFCAEVILYGKDLAPYIEETT